MHLILAVASWPSRWARNGSYKARLYNAWVHPLSEHFPETAVAEKHLFASVEHKEQKSRTEKEILCSQIHLPSSFGLWSIDLP